MSKIFFPALIIFLLLIVDGFLLNDLQLEEKIKFPAFKTVTLDGEQVTQNIFDGKITILCIWTTNAEISFEVLSQLEEMQKNLPADTQIFGLVGNSELDEAKKISKKFSPSIIQLTVNDDFFPVLTKIKTVPTTIFIDKHGNLIGQPAGGTDAKFIRRELNYILEKDSPKFLAAEKIQENILYR